MEQSGERRKKKKEFRIDPVSGRGGLKPRLRIRRSSRFCQLATVSRVSKIKVDEDDVSWPGSVNHRCNVETGVQVTFIVIRKILWFGLSMKWIWLDACLRRMTFLCKSLSPIRASLPPIPLFHSRFFFSFFVFFSLLLDSTGNSDWFSKCQNVNYFACVGRRIPYSESLLSIIVVWFNRTIL